MAALVLLTSCAGTASRPPTAQHPATATAGTGTPSCPDQSGGISGFASSADLASGSQLVLGRISVNTGYLDMPVPVTGDGPWRYWQKRGVLILAGTGPVLVSVPPAWRDRAAITYGSYGIVSSLELTTCRQPSGVWDGYAGGIYLRAPASCIPVVFAIGNRSVTVRFSVAGRCN
jgi:hypothetical protein